MKHVGLNVASDPLFTVAYTGVSGALVIVSADDPGMASSQNEQDNRRYAVAAGVPMLEPSDSQEAYDFLFAAFEISERWKLPVILRATTRVCHSYTIVQPRGPNGKPKAPKFERDIRGRVMIPAYARPAHKRLRQKLAEIQEWNETSSMNRVVKGGKDLGIITSGISFMHAREAAPKASVLKLSVTYPLPMKKIAEFAKGVDRCVVIEEGDPYLVDAIRGGHCGRGQGGDVSFWRAGCAPRAAHPGPRRESRAGEAAGQTAAIVRCLPVPAGFRIVAQARLHRGRRHWLLHAGRVAAV
jgi:indolepyruvate ferredoxin oxidoreductase alpha subunit